MSSLRLSETDIVGSVRQRVSLYAIISDVQYRQMSNGGDMVTFKMLDKECSRGCTSFVVTPELKEKLEALKGKVCHIMFDVKPYDKGEDGISCILYEIDEAIVNEEDGLDFATFVPCVEHLELYAEWLNNLLATYSRDTIYGDIAIRLLNKYWDTFSILPAASSYHHDIRGGLLQHSVSVAMISMGMYDKYRLIYGDDLINPALLAAGALIHDIGKCFELEDTGVGKAQYSVSSITENHTTRGILEVDRIANELGYTGYKEVAELEHLIASHHGRVDTGAIMEPTSPEAMIVSVADDLDSRINRIFKWLGAEHNVAKSEWYSGGLVKMSKGLSYAEAVQSYRDFITSIGL